MTWLSGPNSVCQKAPNLECFSRRGRRLAKRSSNSATAPTGLTAWFTRPGLIHREGPPLNRVALELGNRRSSGGAIGHLDKAKAFGATSIAVRNHPDLVHRAIRLEELAEVVVGGTKRKIANKNVHT